MFGGLGEGLATLMIILFVGKCWAAWRILTRVEASPLWVIALLFPVIGEGILLWWLAFSRWPRDEEEEEAGASNTNSAQSGEAYWDPGAVGSTDVAERDQGKPPSAQG